MLLVLKSLTLLCSAFRMTLLVRAFWVPFSTINFNANFFKLLEHKICLHFISNWYFNTNFLVVWARHGCKIVLIYCCPPSTYKFSIRICHWKRGNFLRGRPLKICSFDVTQTVQYDSVRLISSRKIVGIFIGSSHHNSDR